MPNKPTEARMIPPMSIQMALSVGFPVKNRDTSELKDSAALMPNIIRTIPPMRMAMEMIRCEFIIILVLGLPGSFGLIIVFGLR